MRLEWKSRKRHLRFVLPIIRSASMSVCFFQAGKVLSGFFLFPMNNCMRFCPESRYREPSARKTEQEVLFAEYVSLGIVSKRVSGKSPLMSLDFK